MGKIRRDDEVIVISGSGKGRRGKVLRVLDENRLIVSGVRMVKRHTRANPQANVPGGIIEKEAAIHVSNVALVDPATGKGTRVGYKTLADKTKVRIVRSSGAVIDG
jgi:large subunit ribosomal protein L24